MKSIITILGLILIIFVMKLIPLTQGKAAIVDDSDYENLSKHKWYYTKLGYAARTDYKGKKRIEVLMQHQIMGSKGIDHNDTNKLNNQRGNLRKATQSQNGANRTGWKNSYSKFKGVTYDNDRNKWKAHIKFNYKTINLGRFDDEIAAAEAYDDKAKELFGEFAFLNFPERKKAV